MTKDVGDPDSTFVARPASGGPAPPGLKWPPLLVVGLTGGIASGKSTIAAMLARRGATVFNADAVGRAVVQPGEPALAEIVAAFGRSYLSSEGRLDRLALGERVFRSRSALNTLNRITHPRIGARLKSQLASLARRPPNPPVVLLEAAVLVEGGWTSLADTVLVVVTQPSTQLTRLTAGLGLSPEQARARIGSQLPLRQRLRHADYQICGEGSIEETEAAVGALWRDLLSRASEGRGGRPRRPSASG